MPTAHGSFSHLGRESASVSPRYARDPTYATSVVTFAELEVRSRLSAWLCAPLEALAAVAFAFAFAFAVAVARPWSRFSLPVFRLAWLWLQTPILSIIPEKVVLDCFSGTPGHVRHRIVLPYQSPFVHLYYLRIPGTKGLKPTA
ncbi:hypothetical protein NOR_06528 [Metarhizium rileyi]|uniref:Uncharacterized protein n=1 Tax=Metarhizium rileyi (strain RCEF 4871) TaxID=1649241 RepID=A0A167AG21_METRR|nr:hypothetical protein NOR_06528 [Metarhizium rileyi RCEF 4871]